MFNLKAQQVKRRSPAAPLCKGGWRRQATGGLSTVFYNPSGFAALNHLPLHKGGFCVRLYRSSSKHTA